MSNTKYIPILFKPEMVNAILEGRKTQTRRLNGLDMINKNPEEWEVYKIAGGANQPYSCYSKNDTESVFNIKQLYQVGNVLWVREKFCFEGGAYYFHDDPQPFGTFKFKPSIHMPKAACRMFLEVTEVRVQRLKDINDKGALAEGIEFYYSDMFKETRYKDYCPVSHIQYQHAPKGWCGEWREPTNSFLSLWAKINGKASVNANPFVWAITFKSIDKPANWPN